MRRVVILFCLTIVLLAGAAYLYRDPRVRELFRSAPSVRHGLRNSSAARAKVKPKQSPTSRAEGKPRQKVIRLESEPVSELIDKPRNRTPNETVTRVLLQVLAAKDLVSGVSLEVSDRAVRVFGEVESAEKRQAILAIIEKAREMRQVDAGGLIVLN